MQIDCVIIDIVYNNNECSKMILYQVQLPALNLTNIIFSFKLKACTKNKFLKKNIC